MEHKLHQVVVSALLHDYGKCVHRSGLDGRAHSFSAADRLKKFINDSDILKGIRYHHKKHLLKTNIEEDAIAYLVYFADNVAAGTDRREIEGEDNPAGFRKDLPLSSIFNFLVPGDKPGKLVYPPTTLAFHQGIPFPTENHVTYDASFYNSIVNNLDSDLNGIIIDDPAYINSLLSILEGYWSYLPSSTNLKEAADISLYDHAKITTAIASATYQYLIEENIDSFRKSLVEKEKEFQKEEAFFMTKLDISGIQSFIYTTSSSEALKNLRARSLYLELLTEHLCDELLAVCGLSRANLIYSGGVMHCYSFPTRRKQNTHWRIISNISRNGSLMLLELSWRFL